MQYDHTRDDEEARRAQQYITDAQRKLREDNLRAHEAKRQGQSQWRRPRSAQKRPRNQRANAKNRQRGGYRSEKVKDARPIFERWGGGLAAWLEFFSFAVFATVSLLGLISVSLVDVTFGSVSLGAIFANGIPIGDKIISPLTMALFVSVATSGVQSVVWTLVTQELKDSQKAGSMDWASPTVVAGLIFALVLIVTDTMIDTSVLTWVVYGVSPLEHTFLGHGMIFNAAQIIVALITSCSELLVALLIVIVRSMAQAPEFADKFRR